MLNAAFVSSGTSDIKIALVALAGVLAGALLGYVGKSRELRLLIQGELRRLYAELLASRSSMDLSRERFEDAKKRSDSHWASLDIGDEEDYEMLKPSVRDASARLFETMRDAQHTFQSEARRFAVVLSEVQIQAPRDTHKAASLWSERVDVVAPHTVLAYDMFVLLARRDLTPYRSMWMLREAKATTAKRVDWWTKG